MTMAIATITQAIANLVVSNVTILDIDQIPDAVDARASYLIPKPDGFISGFKCTRQNMGQDTDAKWNVEYDLNYCLCVYPVGTERGLFVTFPIVVERAFAVAEKALTDTTITGAVQFELGSIGAIGTVTDPRGTQFIGCILTFHVLEFVNG